MSALTDGLNHAYLQSHEKGPLPKELRPQGLIDWKRPELPRKAPQREGATIFEIAQGRNLFRQSLDHIAQEIDELKASYVFADETVSQFLTDHRAITSILRAAVQPLKASFGADCFFRLEVSIDEEDSAMLCAIVLWRDSVRAAALALDDFAERWWLDHMTPNTTDLAFIYRISR